MVEKNNNNEKIQTTQKKVSENITNNSSMLNNDKSKNTNKKKKEFVIKPGMSFKEILDHYSPIEPTEPVKIIELYKGFRRSDIKRVPQQAINYLIESIKEDNFDSTTFFVLSTYPWDEANTI